MVYRILALLISISMLSYVAIAKEQYPGQYAQVSPEIKEFFKNYKRTIPPGPNQPGGEFNCCDISDCHVLTSDMWEIRGTDYWVYIKEWEDRPNLNPWVKVPNGTLVLDQPNPTGGAVACYKTQSYNDNMAFYCFTPGYLM